MSATDFLKNPASRPGLALGLIAVIALLLRLSNLDVSSLWIDEIYSFVVANGHVEATQIDVAIHPASWFYERLIAWQPLQWDKLLELLKHNVHMPLYYLLLNPWLGFWEKTVGLNDVLALRSLSVLFSVLTIIPLYLLGKEIAGTRTSLLVAFLATVSPFQLYYAQEGRMYTLAMCWAAWSSLALWKTLYAEKSFNWSLLYALCVCAGVLTHYMFVFFLGFHLLYGFIWLSQQRKEEDKGFQRFRLLGIAVLGLVGIAAWWAPVYKIQQQGVTDEYHFAKGLVAWTRYLEVFVWQPLVVLAGENNLMRAFYFPLTLMLLWDWVWMRVVHPHRMEWKREGFLLCWVFVPLLIQVVYDLFSGTHTAVIDRYVLLISPAMLLWLGLALDNIWQLGHQRLSQVTLVGLLCLAVAAVWTPSPFRDEHNKKDVAGKIKYMLFNSGQDLIFANGPYGVPGLAAYYLASQPDNIVAVDCGEGQNDACVQTYSERQVFASQPLLYWINRYAGREYPLPDKKLFAPYQRVWLFRTRANNERGLQTAKDYLKSMYPKVEESHDWFIYTR